MHQHRLGVAAVGAGMPPGVAAVHRGDCERRPAGVQVALEGPVGLQVAQQHLAAAAQPVQEDSHGQQLVCAPPGESGAASDQWW